MPAAPTPFGQQVSQMAHANKAAGLHPGVDGKVVSDMARARHSTATDDPSEGDIADRSGDGTGDQSGDSADPSGDGTGDQSGDGDSAEPSGDGSGDTAAAGGSSHGKSAGHGHH
jgi:hypothetical protein